MAKFAPIQLSATGVIVAAVANKRIRVLSYVLSFSGSVNVKFQSTTGPVDLTGLLYGVANTVVPGSYAQNGMDGQSLGLFQTVPGDSLTLNLSGSVAVGGHITYAEVN